MVRVRHGIDGIGPSLDAERGSPWALAPGLGELRGYRRGQLRPDLFAGVTGAAVAVPAGFGDRRTRRAQPVAGLWAWSVGGDCRNYVEVAGRPRRCRCRLSGGGT